MPTDNRTANYNFKKPFAGNNLSDDADRLAEALDGVDTQIKASNDAIAGLGDSKQNAASKGVANGYASLDSGGLVPAGQLPSYVDDVLEAANFAALPVTGETGKIYVLAAPYTSGGFTSSQYRWTGSVYAAIVASPGTTDSLAEGASNLYHTVARVRGVLLTGISLASDAVVSATDTILEAIGRLQAQITGIAAAAMVLTNKTINFANNTFTGALNLNRATVASHATTAAIWSAAGNQIDYTGNLVATAFPNAPHGGAERTLIIAGTPGFTAGANMLIDGVTSGQTMTCAANDTVIVRAITTTQFKLTRDKADGTAQAFSAAVLTMIRSARTSNTIIGVADKATLIDITSGTFTQTFVAAATLANGWSCHIRNGGTGDITVDPNGAETIDGLASFVMYPGEVRLIQCDGTALRSIVISSFSRTFIATETFTKPPGYQQFGGLIWGGGSSGRKSGDVSIEAAGGAGAGCGDFTILATDVGATVSVTIGAGGAAVSGAANGNIGGTSSFGSFISSFANTTYNAGGSISDQMVANGGRPPAMGYEGGCAGITAFNMSSIWGGSASDGNSPSGLSIHGGAAGGSLSNSAVLRTAGTSKFGGDGGAASSTGNGTAGVTPGGGGGATQTGGSSGAGARGEIRIWGLV